MGSNGAKNVGLDMAVEKGESGKLTKKIVSQKTWIVVIGIFGSLKLFDAMTYSLTAPLFPQEALSKNVSASNYGTIIGSYELAIFIFNPILGRYMPEFNMKYEFLACIIIQGVSIILFGFVSRIYDWTTFIAYSYVLRISSAFGSAGLYVCTYGFAAALFPESLGMVFAIIETLVNVGFSIGPGFGSFLYEVGGFPVPFLTLGGLILVLGVGSVIVLNMVDIDGSSKSSSHEDIVNDPTERLRFSKAAKIPPFYLYGASVFAAACSLGFLIATLEPHLSLFEEYQLTVFQKGLVFTIQGVTSAIASPIFGKICPKLERIEIITTIGFVLIAISFVLIGPVHFIPLELNLISTCLGLGLFGIGSAAAYVSTFVGATNEAKNYGFPSSMKTSSLIASMWMSCLSLGVAVGPSIGGYLFDQFGFRISSSFILGLNIIMAHILATFTLFRCKTWKMKAMMMKA